jgi:hypothetical protein
MHYRSLYKGIWMALLFLHGLALQAQQTQTISKPTYSLAYPATWELEPGADAKQCTIKAPADSGVVLDEFVENLNLVIEQLPAPYTAKEYAEFSKGYLPQKIKSFVLLKSAKSTLGADSWQMEFKGIQFGKKLQWKQVYIIKRAGVHILTFTGTQNRFAAYQKEVNAMLKSYRAKR